MLHIMRFPFAIVTLVVIFNTGINAKPPSKIMNGKETYIQEAPFVVRLHDNSNLDSFIGLVCGGTIIGKRHILTAAHCLGQPVSDTEENYNYNWLSVVAGITSYECGVETYEILDAYIHPDFSSDVNDDVDEHADLAVLKLKDRLIFGPTQSRIQLAKDLPAIGSSGLIYGWGITDPDDPYPSRILLNSDQRVYDYRTCRRSYRSYGFLKDELCIMGNPGTSCGQGDSGGPLIVNGELVGVMSNSFQCGSSEPSAVSNVVYHRSWIKHAVRSTAPSRSLPFIVETHTESPDNA